MACGPHSCTEQHQRPCLPVPVPAPVPAPGTKHPIQRYDNDDEGSFIDSLPDTRHLQAFGKKVTATAGSLIGAEGVSQHYQNAIGELHRELRRPLMQRSVFSFAQTTPREIVRSRISVPEIQQRALAYIPNDLLANIPEDNSEFSLFQGFEASLPEKSDSHQAKHGRHNARGQRLIGGGDDGDDDDANVPPSMRKLRNQRHSMGHRLEMMGVRKHMC
ncbi:WD repeat-containing protein, partial [Pyrenophora tritici-repentis Pt-1C-BFP]